MSSAGFLHSQDTHSHQHPCPNEHRPTQTPTRLLTQPPTYVSQVAGQAVAGNAGVLGLHKVADVAVGAEHRALAQAGKGPRACCPLKLCPLLTPLQVRTLMIETIFEAGQQPTAAHKQCMVYSWLQPSLDLHLLSSADQMYHRVHRLIQIVPSASATHGNAMQVFTYMFYSVMVAGKAGQGRATPQER